MTFRSMTIVGVLVCLGSSANAKDDFKSGWKVEYQQDVFSSELFAVAYASQETEGISFDASQLQVYCSKQNDLTVAFSVGGVSFERAFDVSLKIGDEVKIASFRPTKVAGDRPVLGADQATSATLISLLTAHSGAVPFKTGDKQGLLPTIGFREAMEAVKRTCGSPS